MNKPNFFSRFELLFWNFTIQALSQSRTTQKILRRIFQFLHDSEAPTFGILLGVSGVVGLVSGYFFYFITVGLR
ncbi:MAG: hypothetical protein IH586_22555 [Anaerolineaceae bacterium]|nr:hypothetical protein [Anaerolineaceae bacterium]